MNVARKIQYDRFPSLSGSALWAHMLEEVKRGLFQSRRAVGLGQIPAETATCTSYFSGGKSADECKQSLCLCVRFLRMILHYILRLLAHFT